LGQPQSMKHVRLITAEVDELLTATEEDAILKPGTEDEFDRKDIELVLHTMKWMLNRNHCDHPLDVIQHVRNGKPLTTVRVEIDPPAEDEDDDKEDVDDESESELDEDSLE